MQVMRQGRLSSSDATYYSTTFDRLRIDAHILGQCSCIEDDNSDLGRYRRRHSPSSLHQMPSAAAHRRPSDEVEPNHQQTVDLGELDTALDPTRSALALQNGKSTLRQQNDSAVAAAAAVDYKLAPRHLRAGSLAMAMNGHIPDVTGASIALNDTPATTAPNSPRIMGNTSAPGSVDGSDGGPPPRLPLPIRQNSGTTTPRVRPTTLDIPGLTKSKVSPDGRIASRDVGSKLVIVMVGLPARGKSYITKKLARYLNWLQHDTRIFNVGERRRVAAGGPNTLEKTKSHTDAEERHDSQRPSIDKSSNPKQALQQANGHAERQSSVAQIMLNDDEKLEAPATPPVDSEGRQLNGGGPMGKRRESLATTVLSKDAPEEPQEEQEQHMEHNSNFFDPQNKKAAQIREQVARETLDELLDYILYENGSVGILDATNSTLERRRMIMNRIRERAGPQLNVLFLESSCLDQELLEANMRLKLNGPDYKEMDPVIALEDFKKRVREYEKAYVALGEYEERNHMPYIQMIDVGRKVISHQIKGFLMAQANYYLLNFNLAPRQIWITRHGLSLDNVSGKIGGDSDLAPEGHLYAKSLAKFMEFKRNEWDLKQLENLRNTHFPPQPGDSTPPNPWYHPQSPSSEEAGSVMDEANELGYEPKPFCVWTSMLKRSIQTAQYFNEEIYDTKQMRMLDELNAGIMEGLTYNCISTQHPDQYRERKVDKLHYRYPGPGGEGYLDVINRLRPVIVELERMEDHVLLIGHRSVARILLAYFRGLKREEVADLDVPIGMLYCLEPKPYGVDFKAYRWERQTEWFHEVPGFELKRAEDDML